MAAALAMHLSLFGNMLASTCPWSTSRILILVPLFDIYL